MRMMIDNDKRFKEPYEVIEAKLDLAETTMELVKVREEKWERMETMKDIMEREEALTKDIATKTALLRDMMNGKK
jgi:hypothetical protein